MCVPFEPAPRKEIVLPRDDTFFAMSTYLWGTALLALLAIVPPILIRFGRGRLAQSILARPGAPPALLTPADRCAGRFRRVPGVLGLTRDAIAFESHLESPAVLPLARVKRVLTANRMASGRRLWRAEILTIVDADDHAHEYLMPRASAYQWRQHLGAWAARQKGRAGPF